MKGVFIVRRSAVYVLFLSFLWGNAWALNLEVAHAYHAIHGGWSPPPSDFLEGSILTTIIGDAPIDTVGFQEGLVRVAQDRWTYRSAWNDSLPRTFSFRSPEGETAILQTVPVYGAYIPGAVPLPLVTIDTGLPNLWSPETGIYVWGDGEIPNWDQRGAAWERGARFQYYDASGVLRHDRPIGLRINGNWSRGSVQKSLRLYFDHHGEPDTIFEDFFGDGPDGFERLILRAGSVYMNLFLIDPLACDIMSSLGYPVSRWRPCMVVLNEVPWGLYHIRERPDDEWAELQLGLSGNYNLIKDAEGEHPGDLEMLNDFLRAAGRAADPEDHAYFQMVESEMEMTSYIDWVLLQIWGGSADNGGANNKVVYRPDGGRWHFMIYDEDSLFHRHNLESDFFHFFTSTSPEEFDERAPQTFYPNWGGCRYYFQMFDALTRNAAFRKAMRERWDILVGSVLEPNTLMANLEAVAAAGQLGEEEHQERWEPSYSINDVLGGMRSYFPARAINVQAHFEAFMDQRMDPVEMDALSLETIDDEVHLHWHTQREIPFLGWILERRSGPDAPWVQIADYTASAELLPAGGESLPANYSWIDGTEPEEGTAYRLIWVSTSGQHNVVPWIEEVVLPSSEPLPLLINEFLVSNDSVNQDETGAYEDWVEIINPNPTEVSLAGYYLSDNLDNPTRWAFPASAVIEANGFLLIWCDNDVEDGPLHTNFKLSAGGESIGIYADGPTGIVALDEYTFGQQTTDVSTGRLPDAGPDWVTFTGPTPGGSNSSMVGVEARRMTVVTLSAYPNPFNPSTEIRFSVPEAGEGSLRVYNLRGELVRTLRAGFFEAGAGSVVWDGRAADGVPTGSGVYLCRLEVGGDWAMRRVLLLK